MKEEEIGKFMKDRLSEYQQTPPDGLWTDIAQDASLKKYNRGRRIRRFATRFVLPFAAVLVLTTVAFIIASHNRQDLDNQPVKSLQNKSAVQNNSTVETSITKILSPAESNVIATIPAERSTVSVANNENNLQPMPTATKASSAETTSSIIPTQSVSHPAVDVVEHPAKSPEPKKLGEQQIDITKTSKISEDQSFTNVETVSDDKSDKSGVLRFSQDTLVCRNSKLTLFVENAVEVRWSTGTFEPTLDIYPEEPTVLYANIVTLNGEDTTIYVHVNIYDCELFVPTAFTPNGDGLNDEFLVHAPANFTGYECVIFDRQGRTIFQSKSIYYGWDGTFEGKPISPGAYFYAITYRDELNEKHVQKGQVVLIR